MTSQPRTRLLLLPLACVLTLTHAAIVDLSQDWALSSLYNQNKAYCTLQAAMAPCWTRGYVVIQNGELYAEGYTDGNHDMGRYEAWSATKSWSTFFLGVLVDQGKLSVTETLADIFNNDKDWEGVSDFGNKKEVRVDDLLTMSSGLVPARCQRGVNEGQGTLQEVLNHVDFDANQKGRFHYLPQTHILSRIIERRAPGSPRQWAENTGIISKLGMNDQFDWTVFGTIEGSAYGLQTNPRIMAKLGQLYLQNGLAAAGDPLVNASWVSASVTSYLDNDFCNADAFRGYGYQWYPSSDTGGALAGAAAAFGAEGQTIAFLPASNTTIAIMGQGCLGNSVNRDFLRTIIDNLGDLTVQQSSCDQSFSYWNYFAHHSGQLLSEGLREISSNLRGRNLY